ncbi:MAG: fibronectin type III domain-containing protein, partial [Tannerella sp.]|nr:fibronectin type III domain-containing protein [Tannerella sp.]
MKNIKQFVFTIICVSVVVMVGGCSDNIPNLVTDIDAGRLFSPTELKAQVSDLTDVLISWKKVNKADSYTVEIFKNGDLNFSGSPVISLSNIIDNKTFISDLAIDVSYSVRIKAVSNEISESNWSTVTFSTKTIPLEITEWNFSDADFNGLGSIASAASVTVRGLTIKGAVSVSELAEPVAVDDYNFTHLLKLGGGGSVS